MCCTTSSAILSPMASRLSLFSKFQQVVLHRAGVTGALRQLRLTGGYLDDADKISKILEWSEQVEGFDTDFVMDLEAKLEEYGDLTETQSNALDNIIDRWNIK